MSITKEAISARLNRLAELVSLPGGIRRGEAIAQAEVRVESLRAASLTAIEEKLRGLEALVANAQDNRIDAHGMSDISRLSDGIITLAGTFRLPLLDATARGLCDLISLLRQSKSDDLKPVRVHVQAMRFLMFANGSVAERESEDILRELARVRDRFASISKDKSGA